jgi:hypothetical protein
VKSVLSITTSPSPCHAADLQVQFFQTKGRMHKPYLHIASISASIIIISIIIIISVLNLFSPVRCQVAVFWQAQISIRDQSLYPSTLRMLSSSAALWPTGGLGLD